MSASVPVSFALCLEMNIAPGVFAYGLVRERSEGIKTLYEVLDGSCWEHPGLQPFRGRNVALNFDPAKQRLEVLSWPERNLLAVLDVLPVERPMRLLEWLMTNPGMAVEFRQLLRTRFMPLHDALFTEIPDGVIIVKGVVRMTMGALNGLGGDSEVITENGFTFYIREPPSFLHGYWDKQVTVVKHRGRLTVVTDGIADA